MLNFKIGDTVIIKPTLNTTNNMINDDIKQFYNIDNTPEKNTNFVRYDDKSRIQVEAPQHLKDAVNLEYFNNIPILNVTLEHLVSNDYTI